MAYSAPPPPEPALDLVIVNLQRIPLDRLASLRIFAKCDDVTRLLAKKLSLDIPTFKLHR